MVRKVRDFLKDPPRNGANSHLWAIESLADRLHKEADIYGDAQRELWEIGEL
jgi:hypothetical protein